MRNRSSLCVAAFLATLSLSIAQQTFAQQDTTPPVLVDFAISPVVFDTGVGAVTLNWCVRGRDDLSGISAVWFHAFTVDPGSVVQLAGEGIGKSPAIEQEFCSATTGPQFSRYGQAYIRIILEDAVGNRIEYLHPILVGRIGQGPDLCAAGFICELLNREGGSLPDTDGDGRPDDADNCPTIANPGQEDADLDLLGDVCDPFPNDRDNEQAQCDADLATTQTALDACSAAALDSDEDGVPDVLDNCPTTVAGTAVDPSGCSLVQFCATVDVTVRANRNICPKLDWRNDEPATNPRDCVIDYGTDRGTADDTCMPNVEF